MKIRSLIFFLFLFVTAISVSAQSNYVIEGEVKNVKDGIELILMDVPARTQLATCTIKNGTFRFDVKPIQSGLRKLGLISNADGFPPAYTTIYMREGSYVKVIGENNLNNLWKVESDIKENQSLAAYFDYFREDETEFAKCATASMDLQRQLLTATEAEKSQISRKMAELKNHSWNIQLDIWKKSIEYFKTAEVDAVWWEFVTSLAKNSRMDDFPDKEGVKALYNALSDEHKQSIEGKSIFTILYPAQVAEDGKPMIDAELFDLQGNKHSLAEFKGTYILLDFWNYSCSVCYLAIPEMQEIAVKYKGRLNVVSLSTDKKENWEAASQKHGFIWHNWNDMKQLSGLYAAYGVYAFPHYVLISPNGKIIESWAGYRKGLLLEKMEKLIKY